MNRTRFIKIVSLIMIAAMVMTVFSGCGKNTATAPGEKEFKLIVVDKDATETEFTIKTDEATVGDALLEEGLISGEEGPYGLYVTEVNGIKAVYEEDGYYWAFYIDGEYAMAGVDATDVQDGAEYTLKEEAA